MQECASLLVYCVLQDRRQLIIEMQDVSLNVFVEEIVTKYPNEYSNVGFDIAFVHDLSN